MSINPIRITGKWEIGYALDNHTISSTFLGTDEFGHEQFDTRRSDIGELLYQLKYHGKTEVLPAIEKEIMGFIDNLRPFDFVLPVPPSNKTRKIQPVTAILNRIKSRPGFTVLDDIFAKSKDTVEMKNVYDMTQRQKLLLDTFALQNAQVVKDRIVLLFDDLFRSGATMNSLSTLLYEKGQVKSVKVLTLTKTRSIR